MTKRITALIEDDDYDFLEKICKSDKKRISQIVKMAISRYRSEMKTIEQSHEKKKEAGKKKDDEKSVDIGFDWDDD